MQPPKKRARAAHFHGDIRDAVIGIVWRADKPLTRAEVMAQFEVPPAGGLKTITMTLCGLAKEGLVERAGRGRYISTEWKDRPEPDRHPPANP